MADFWRWEYNYGHELNPDAAIKVPGMSYQPPLIGYKQLLNFGAYSVPDIGGWIFIVVGITLLTLSILAYRSNSSVKVFSKKAGEWCNRYVNTSMPMADFIAGYKFRPMY